MDALMEAAPRDPSGEKWINSQKLDELRLSIGDQLLLEVLDDVQHQLHTAIEQLPKLNTDRNSAELRLLSHSLLGAARELSFEKISDLCRVIEVASIEQQFDHAEPLIQQLVRNRSMIDSEIEEYRSRFLDPQRPEKH